jgi:hypothetical protein
VLPDRGENMIEEGVELAPDRTHGARTGNRIVTYAQ